MPQHFYQLFHATDNSIQFHCLTNTNTMSLNFHLTCPRLERASLSKFLTNGFNIQWDNLTRLTLHSMSIFDSCLILRKTPRLVFCTLSGYSMSYSIGSPVLTSLRSLLLCMNSYVKDFLDNVIAPHFFFQDIMFPQWRSLPLVSEDLLVHCVLSLCLASFQHTMKVLQSMPSLNMLSIIGGCYP